MSGTTVIDRLAVQWRAVEASPRDRDRFDRLARALAGAPLESALEHAIDSDDVVCVRSVEVPLVRCTADVTDEELLATLSVAIAGSIEAAASGWSGESGAALRYHSRSHAVLDLVTSLSRGDRRHEWAWRQLGLWPDTGEPAEAGERFAVALSESPSSLPGVLSAAAAEDAFQVLAALLGPVQLDRLVRLAWSGAGRILPEWHALLMAAMPASGAGPSAAAEELMRRSALGRALLAGSGLPPRSVAAASAAAVLEAEPSLALGPAARALPLVGAAALLALRDSGRPGGASTSVAALAVEPVGTGQSGEIAARPPRDELQQPHGSLEHDAAAASGGPEGAGSPSERAGVPTTFGGLPFLLHLVEVTGLPARGQVGELGDLGLVRVLYEVGADLLARLLGGGEQPDDDDASLACLCGRSPAPGWSRDVVTGELPWSRGSMVVGEADRLVAALRASLEPSWLADAEEHDLLGAICRRHGRVTADPGWIDVHLEIIEVSTDVRRAGLDLDLGYRPWLGSVVRFLYD